MERSTPSRAELLSGDFSRSRRAAKLLAAIEARCTYMRDESRRVVAAYLLGSEEDFRRRFDGDYLQGLKLTASTEALQRDHLECFAAQWAPLVPADPELRARVLRLVGQKYGLCPSMLAALRGTEPEVQAAYRQLFGGSPDELTGTVAAAWATAVPYGDDEGHPYGEARPLGDAPAEAWQDVETRLEWVSLAGGETLFRAGDPGDSLYVVISGRVRAVIAEEDGSEHVVQEIGRGEMVGEMAVLTGDLRSATVRAVRDSELVRLRRDDLLSLARRRVEVLVRINALIARRMLRQYAQLARVENSTLLTYALLPCGPDSAASLADFGRRLVEALAAFGPAAYVTSATLDDAIEHGAGKAGLDDPRNAQIASWLNELESRYRYVVYEAGPEASEWSRRCIRQADRVLLVGRNAPGQAAPPLPAAHEVALLASLPAGPAGSYGLPRPQAHGAPAAAQRSNQVEFVLLHEPGSRSAAGAAQWLAPRALRSHYHVRLGNPGDMAFLARCLTGRAIGLVLSGGGARGFAHIGVIRALEEAGVPVDLIGGSSMGALVGGALAMGRDWQQMKDVARSFASPRKLFDPTVPVVSLFSSGKLTRAIREMYGEALIEDLRRPMYCVSSNLSRGTETIYRQGPLWLAVRASVSIPGVFAPVLHDGDLHVDGGAMNNLPADVMREFGQAGTVVCVDLRPPLEPGTKYSFPPAISGLRAALSLVNPHDDISVLPITENLMRVMTLHGDLHEAAVRRLADICITPRAEEYSVLDFASYDPIIEIGYRAGQEAIAAAQWPAYLPCGR